MCVRKEEPQILCEGKVLTCVYRMYGPNTSPQAWQFPITNYNDWWSLWWSVVLLFCGRNSSSAWITSAWITSVHALDCSPPEENLCLEKFIFLCKEGLIEWLSEAMKRLHFLKFKFGKLVMLWGSPELFRDPIFCSQFSVLRSQHVESLSFDQNSIQPGGTLFCDSSCD